MSNYVGSWSTDPSYYVRRECDKCKRVDEQRNGVQISEAVWRCTFCWWATPKSERKAILSSSNGDK